MSILQFSEHFQLIFDNSNVSKGKKIKQKKANFFAANLSDLSKCFFLILLRQDPLKSKVALTTATARPSCYTLAGKTFSKVELFSIFSHTYFGTNFRHQNKNNVVETINCFVYQLSIKYCVYYVSEHLKYCAQINEY